MKIFIPPQPKSKFLANKGIKTAKISHKHNQLGFGSNCQGKLEPIIYQSWWQKIFPTLAKIRFLVKKGVNPPKPAQNSTHLDLAVIFSVSKNQYMIKVSDKKIILSKQEPNFLTHLSQNPIFFKKRVKGPIISPKLKQVRIDSYFQCKLKTINFQIWWEKILPHLSQNLTFWHEGE